KKIVYYAGYAGRKPNFVDTYITKPGAQSFENYPWRSGPSLIVEVPAGVKFTRLGYRPSGYPAEITGNFVSDDDGLNQLWQEALNSVVINMRDTFMDCPDRERAPYAGDAANQIDILLYGLDSSAYGMIQKTILTEIGWTKTDKILPSRAPSKTPHEIPVQSLAFIVEVYNYYLHTGDADTLNLFYPVAMDYLKLFNLKADNMLETRDGSWMWTDWGNNADVEVIQNAWYYYAVSNMSKLAAALEITADNAFMSARMSALKTGFTAKYKKQDGGFRSGAKDDDRANALAVLGGLADPGDYAALIPILTNTKEASIYMEKFVLEALCVMGEYETAKDRILERYAPMLTDSYTTLWEGWTIDDADFVSLNHGWSGGFLTVMSKYFAGIRPTAEGFSKYEIFPKNLFDSLNCAVDTGDGKITLSVTKNGNGGYTMNIHAVSGEGVLKISSDFGGTVSISGGAYTQNPDGTGYKSYTLSGGDYVVEIS
ncbi:MAG: hypothetical protein LBL66_01165, partial [Clostridiales bacterium]|nr:hypothetical protein [Clostridiales bacterium]